VRHSYYANSKCLRSRFDPARGIQLSLDPIPSIAKRTKRVRTCTIFRVHPEDAKNHAQRGTIAPDAEDLPRRSSKAHLTWVDAFTGVG